jgi:PPOX class probable F420-dependent enzyme
MPTLTPDVEAVFNTGARLAHFITLRADGRPQVTVVWTGVEDGEIVMAHMAEHQKVKNVRRDPRVTLSVMTGGRNSYGMDEYLVVEGTARVTEGGSAELLNTLAQRYVGPGTKYPPVDNPPAGFVTRVTVTKVGGVGPWA